MTFFDDIEIGAVTEFGNHTFTAEAIKRFAKAYDPQPFHVNEEAAERGVETLQWQRPIRVGDTLGGVSEVISLRAMRPARALLISAGKAS